MKKNLFKLTALLVAIMTLASMLVGCGSTSTSQNTAASTASNTSTATTAAVATTPAENPVTLKFLFLNEWASATEGQEIPAYLESQFYKDNPNIKVDLEMCPVTDYDQKILTVHAAGGQYDMFFVNNTSTGMFVQGGALADITDLVKNSTINTNDFFPGIYGAGVIDGKIYALPFETDCRLLAYNKKMLADAGVQPPKTVDEFMAAAKACTKNGKYGFVDAIANNSMSPFYDIGFSFLGDGGSFIVKDGDTYKANFNTPEGIKFIQRCKELVNYMPKDAFNYDYNKFYAAFAQGQVAMEVYGPWIYGQKDIEDAKLDYGLTLIPSGSKTSASTMGGWLIGVSGDSKNKEAAFKVIEFFEKPEVNANINAALSPMGAAYNYGNMKDDKYKVFVNQFKTAIMPFPAGFTKSAQVADAFFKEWSKAVLTDAKAEDEAKACNDAMQAVIDAN